MKCCLCGKECGKYGNNALPVKDGRCCDDCNVKVVIPARLSKITFACVKCKRDFGSKIVAHPEIEFHGKENLIHKNCNGEIHGFAIFGGK